MPDAAQYPVQTLNLYPTWTRDTYLAAFGVQAPPFDASKPVKNWFATDATQFTCFDFDKKAFVPVTMDATTAASVNLTGAYNYSAYAPPVNIATWMFFGTLQSVTSGFVRPADAQAVAASLGGTAVERMSVNGGPFVYQSSDSKLYDVVIPNVQGSFPADLLMQMWTHAGVGHAGSWSDPTKSWPSFTPTPDYTQPQNNTPVGPSVPVRALNPVEQLQFSMMGVLVIRTDKQSQPSPAGGSFTDIDRQNLVECHTMLQKIIAMFHIQ